MNNDYYIEFLSIILYTRNIQFKNTIKLYINKF